MENEYYLEMSGISKTFPGAKVLDSIEFNVKAGEVRALMGENGAGKSTLIKILGGIYDMDPGQGTIRINGQEAKINTVQDAQHYGCLLYTSRVPTTWEEYNKVARLFTRKFNPDSDTLYGTSLSGRVPTGATSEYLPRIWAQGIDLFNGETAINDREKAVYALENYIECYDYAHPDAPDWWWDDEAMDFCQGNSAMMVQYSDQVTILRDRNISRVVGKVGYDVVPGNASLFGGWSIGMNSHSKEKAAAYEFIKWAASERMSVVNAVLGRIIPYTSICDSTELLNLYPWHKETFEVFQDAKKRFAPNTADGRCISENVFEKIIGSTVNEAITKKCTAKEAVDRMDTEIGKIYLR